MLEILRVGEHFKRRENISSVWGNILKEERTDPQCGGTFKKKREQILSVGEHFKKEKRSSEWGNILKEERTYPQCGGTF